VQKTLIDGQIYFDRQRDIAQRSTLAAEKQSLLDKEKKAAESQKADEKKSDENSEKKPDKKPNQKKKPPQYGHSNLSANATVATATAGGAR
jgi:hypothetical protein